MPRSFLVKNYHRKSELDQMQDEGDFYNYQDAHSGYAPRAYPSSYLEYAHSLLSLSTYRLEYELEKSYWFDTDKLNKDNKSFGISPSSTDVSPSRSSPSHTSSSPQDDDEEEEDSSDQSPESEETPVLENLGNASEFFQFNDSLVERFSSIVSAASVASNANVLPDPKSFMASMDGAMPVKTSTSLTPYDIHSSRLKDAFTTAAEKNNYVQVIVNLEKLKREKQQLQNFTNLTVYPGHHENNENNINANIQKENVKANGNADSSISQSPFIDASFSNFSLDTSLKLPQNILTPQYPISNVQELKVKEPEPILQNNYKVIKEPQESQIIETNRNTKEETFDNADTFVWENLEEKLTQMLSDDQDLVKKNLRLFLDNNRIPFEEIAVETDLGKTDIETFLEGKSNFEMNNKKELYRWYLTKILRPHKGTGDESYTCYRCGKIFAYESYLERHIKYVCPDSTGRTWKCGYCGKAFQYPCYLRRHIRSHTGESPYKCDKCDRAFVRSTDLQRHIRNHTGEKPYSCKECKRAFARSTDLKRHMRTHTGEKPYKCWQCRKSFSQSGSLQTHLHTHNKEPSPPKRGRVKSN